MGFRMSRNLTSGLPTNPFASSVLTKCADLPEKARKLIRHAGSAASGRACTRDTMRMAMVIGERSSNACSTGGEAALAGS
mmetsp:Transcript_28413/g.43749  ORF Transcript_28413/g.43749 Transcript_28413/m.43749 type:complete len:80 (+) Transcript_28413:32-271(+)